MSLFGLLFLFLIIYFIVVPLIKLGTRIYAARRQFRQATSAFRTDSGQQQPRQRRGGWSAPAGQRQKIYSRDAGEYVKFEEMPPSPNQTEHSTETFTETQITDAEWEEIDVK